MGKIDLVFGIIKAILIFIFRLALLVPMLMLTILSAVIGANEHTVAESIGICICHPFKALGEAIRNIKYEIDTYRG